MPWNGQQIYQRSQVYIRIERGVAQEDWPLVDGNGKPRSDQFGNPMYLHRKDGATAQTILHVLKANDGVRGKVAVLMPAYAFIVIEVDQQLVEDYNKTIYQERK